MEEVPLPEVSIIVPAYNQEKYIEKCIQSALNQSYRDCEIIIVNDGSTDSTGEICMRYASETRYFEKQNGGPSSALNVGLREMRGTWFKWLSADDKLKPRCVEALVEKAKETREHIFYGDWERIDHEDRSLGLMREKVFENHEDFCRSLFNRFIGNADTTLIEKTCFARTGPFDESLRFGEDYLMWLKLAKHYRFVHVPEVLAEYRSHSGQLSKKVVDRLKENNDRIRLLATKYWYGDNTTVDVLRPDNEINKRISV
jgi:glycosyltransferase involved in cell wall biosynthesis